MKISERTTNGAMCHWRIEKLARIRASQKYEEFASNNDFYKMWPRMAEFVESEWGIYIPEARSALAKVLGLKHISQEAKEEIMEALALDRSLPVGRIGGMLGRMRKVKRMRMLSH